MAKLLSTGNSQALSKGLEHQTLLAMVVVLDALVGAERCLTHNMLREQIPC